MHFLVPLRDFLNIEGMEKFVTRMMYNARLKEFPNLTKMNWSSQKSTYQVRVLPFSPSTGCMVSTPATQAYVCTYIPYHHTVCYLSVIDDKASFSRNRVFLVISHMRVFQSRLRPEKDVEPYSTYIQYILQGAGAGVHVGPDSLYRFNQLIKRKVKSDGMSVTG